jgi:transcriptional regulator with XRE-family HTH domain
MGFRENLIAAMRKKNMNQAQLSKKADIPKSTISSWLRAKGESPAVSLDYLRRVAQKLEITVFELAYGMPDPNETTPDTVMREIVSGMFHVTISKVEKKTPKSK